MIMTLFTHESWPSYVPAVAVIRRRQVLFIFNGFKGYLDGTLSLKRDWYARVTYEEVLKY